EDVRVVHARVPLDSTITSLRGKAPSGCNRKFPSVGGRGRWLRGRRSRRRGEQFLQRFSPDGFDEIAIEARLRRARLVLRLPPTGECDEKRLSAAAGANPARDLVTVHAGHADIEQNDVWNEARHRFLRELDHELVPGLV